MGVRRTKLKVNREQVLARTFQESLRLIEHNKWVPYKLSQMTNNDLNEKLTINKKCIYEF